MPANIQWVIGKGEMFLGEIEGHYTYVRSIKDAVRFDSKLDALELAWGRNYPCGSTFVCSIVGNSLGKKCLPEMSLSMASKLGIIPNSVMDNPLNMVNIDIS